MNRLSRRALFAGSAAMAMAAALPVLAGEAGWIEVVGHAFARNAADRDAARRRALADALLSAALAGGAEVRGHTAMRNARITSDLLIVRPVGRVLEHRVVAAAFDGQAWTVRIRARVGGAVEGDCAERRRLVLAAPAPVVRVASASPAWAAALAPEIAARIVAAAEASPSVTRFLRLMPEPDPTRDRVGLNYLSATRRRATAPAGAHRLDTDMHLAPEGHDLRMTLDLRLTGPAGEAFATRHVTDVPLPKASPLGRVAVLVGPGRAELSRRLSRGAVAAVHRLIDASACRPVVARLRLAGGQIVVDAGRRHGLTRASLAFTADAEGPTGMLEVFELGDDLSVLRPLDPQLAPAHFAGRAVRFLDLSASLP